MEPLTPLGWVLATALITLAGGIVVKYMATQNRVSEATCAERRSEGDKLILAMFKTVEGRLDIIQGLLQSALSIDLKDNKKSG